MLFDTDTVKIHTIKNFISPEECAAVEAKTRKKLNRATVANGSGGSEYSDNRKALQASMAMPWKSEMSGDLVARLGRRIFEYTNGHTNFELDVSGQEDLMSIQYTGAGRDSADPPDRYMPHCDGECIGDSYVSGGRVATMLMYCATPEVGGNTNFAKANVQVKPEAGSATWFTYAALKYPEDGGRVTGEADDGYSEHSGCPVVVGTKKILTLWMRAGVSEENPWDSFDTRGLKRDEVKKFNEKVEGFDGGGEFGDEL